MKDIKISVVVTAYNVEKYIELCILSILNSTYTNLEILVVNDCSTDNTSSIVETILDSRLSIIYNLKNYGAGKSRKIGIEHSTGDYVITIDADDYIDKTFIESLVNAAVETDADIVSGGVTVLDMNTDKYTSYTYGNRVVTGSLKITDFFGEDIVFLNNKIVRRSLYKIVSYSERRYIEDTFTVAKLLYYATIVTYTNNAGYFYRQRKDSLCHSASKFKTDLFRALCAKDLYVWFKGKGEDYTSIFGHKLFLQYASILIKDDISILDILSFLEEWNEFTISYFQLLKDVLKNNSTIVSTRHMLM